MAINGVIWSRTPSTDAGHLFDDEVDTPEGRGSVQAEDVASRKDDKDLTREGTNGANRNRT